MLAKVSYDFMGGNSLSGKYNGKEQSFLIRVQTNAENIANAIKDYGSSKNVIAFDYYGEVDGLNDIPSTTKAIILHKDIDSIDMNIELFLNTVPSNVRVAFKLPNNYCDMRSVIEASQKYGNITFCGGNFIRLDGAKIGCIRQSDFSKRIPDSKVPLTCKGCSCLMGNVDYDDIVEPVFSNQQDTFESSIAKKPTSNKKSATSSRAKKQNVIDSLAAMLGDAGF